MGRHWQATVSQGNTMEKYTTPTPLLQDQTHMGGPGEVLGTPASTEEPSHAELLAAIQGFRVALEERCFLARHHLLLLPGPGALRGGPVRGPQPVRQVWRSLITREGERPQQPRLSIRLRTRA
ncbi:hypothetical protein NDU88_001485 [Pleurodeles waltl]|uniref:Uncharacterized protein n=1 Tax=Pleurodeles waltl TaxID=8319 RepID=A0AAV7LY26_PLEWA|nr:hypothetical protein NDU88_001485 [Pleurodeles waltl]